MQSSDEQSEFTAGPFGRFFSAISRARGNRYSIEKRVSLLTSSANAAIARVRGTSGEYFVLIRARARDERGSIVDVDVTCTCPLFRRDAERCKHVWATFRALDGGAALSLASRASRAVVVTRREEGVLAELEELVRIATSQAASTPPISDEHLALPAPVPPEERVPAALRPAPTGRHWRDWLQPAVAGAEKPRVPRALDRRHRHELSYALDLPLTKREGSLTVDVRERVVGPTTSTKAKRRPVQITHDEIERLIDPLDRRILATLAPARRAPSAPRFTHRYSYAYGDAHPPPVDLLGPRFVASMHGLWREVIVPLAKSGRCEVTFADATSASTLEADEGGPFQIVLVTREDEDAADKGKRRRRASAALRVYAELRRGEEIVPLADLALVLSGGVAFIGPRAIETSADVPFAWLAMLRAMPDGTVLVPEEERADLLRALVTTCGAGALEIAGFAHETRETREPLVVRVRLRSDDRDAPWTKTRPFDAEVTFVYGGAQASFGDGGGVAIDVEGARLVERDRVEEERALEELAAAGFQLSGPRADAGRLTLAASRLTAAVSALPADRFIIEADGLVVRRASSTSFSVSSGIDWFDVDAIAEFDGIVAPMPEILAAIARGDRAVRLGDGKIGILPEDFLARLERARGLSATKGSLRFGRAQIALIEAMLADDRAPIVWRGPLASLKERISSFARDLPPAGTPHGFGGTLRPYQSSGLAWLGALEEIGLSGCLADDMGLGKTVQVLAHLLDRKREGRAQGPSLVVAPRSVVYNWVEEARKFAPSLKVAEHEHVRALGALAPDLDVVVTTYGLLRHEVASLSRASFDYVILDEAHAIKNPQAATTKAALLLRARHRLALSGTPVENHLGELASLFEFLNPGMLGPSVRKTAQKGTRLDPDAAARLGRGLRPFLLRRKKSDVLSELPPRIEQTLHCVLGKEQRTTYDRMKEHYRTTLLARVRKQGVAKNTVHVLEALLRLRQVACHPGLVDRSAERDASAKLEALLEHVETLVAEGKKALVFSQFTSLLDLAGAELARREIAFERLDGSTRDRRARVERFQEDAGCPVFLVSLKAGGVGLNLTAAEYVFVLDPWWNPAAEAQAIDRAHRIGQTRTVIAYRLIAQDTIEERIAELQEKKRALVTSLFAETESTSIGSLSVEDVDVLLS